LSIKKYNLLKVVSSRQNNYADIYKKSLRFIAGEIQRELGIAAPTLSHHLDKLRQVGLLKMEKEKQWIWYSVRSSALKQLLDFLFAECCTRNQVVVLEEDEPRSHTVENRCC
jgi:DNA-binding transcriptional ArsR family regulator